VTKFPRPQGLIDVKLDARTGSRPTFSTSKTIIESLVAEQIPSYTKNYNYMRVVNREAAESQNENEPIKIALQKDFSIKPKSQQKRRLNSQRIRRASLKQTKKWQQRFKKRKIAQRQRVKLKKKQQKTKKSASKKRAWVRPRLRPRQTKRPSRRQPAQRERLRPRQIQRPVRRQSVQRERARQREQVEIPEQLF